MTSLQWEVGEDAWRDGGRSKPPQPGWWARHWRRLLVVVILLSGLSAGGVWGWYRWNSARIQRDLATAVQEESLVMASGDRSALAGVLDSSAPQEWYAAQERRVSASPPPLPIAVEKARLFGDVAMVPVLLPGVEEGAPARRETRFYRLVSAQWLRTEPPAALWGPQRELTTAHFRFLYGDLDAEVVEGFAGQVETLYSDTVEKFNLTETPDDTQFVVEVLPESMPALTLVGRSWLQVGSPYLRPVADSLTNRDVLARQVGGWVVSRLLYRRANLTNTTARLFGFMLYCVGETAVDSWAPRDPAWELARKRYLEGVMAAATGPSVDSRYLLIDSSDWQERYYQCSTLGEFMADHFGAKGFGALALAARSHHSWSEVIETAFTLPYERFEQDWWAFVRERYG